MPRRDDAASSAAGGADVSHLACGPIAQRYFSCGPICAHIAWNRGGIWLIIAYAVWAFIYFAYSRAASGRTAGMALFGVQVVRDDGTGANGRRADVRTLAPCRRPMRRPGL